MQGHFYREHCYWESIKFCSRFLAFRGLNLSLILVLNMATIHYRFLLLRFAQLFRA